MGRPRLYPACSKCGKGVKPDQAGDALDIHKRCPGTIDPNANGMSPLEKARAVMAAKRAEAKASGIPLTRKEKPVEAVVVENMNVEPEVVPEPIVKERVRKAKTVEKYTPPSDPEAPLTAYEVQTIIRNTTGDKDRYVVKHDNKFYLLDDPEKGFSGEGYTTPGMLLWNWFTMTGVLSNMDGTQMTVMKQ